LNSPVVWYKLWLQKLKNYKVYTNTVSQEKRMRFRLPTISVYLFLTIISLFTVSSCTRQESGTTTSNSTEPKKIAFVTNATSDFWTIARRGCEKADQELNDVTVDFRIPSEGTAADQKRVVDDLIVKGIDGLAISLIDPANQTQMVNDISKQVIVVTQDSDAPQSNRLCYIGTDNKAAGRQAGELIKEALPNGGKIMIFVGKIDAQNAQERSQGIKDALQGSKVEILGILTDDTDQVRAKANVADTLVKHPDIDALVGLWSYNGPAIYNAVKEANKIGKVKIITFDEEDKTLEGIKEGAIYATVVQQPYEFGYKSVHMIAKVLRGDKSEIPANKQLIVPTLVIKKENVEEFTAKLNQLRGRA
jgi:ribose transport system substrate-binding protein